jgi:pimeloyl-ACP methyl ester carboxylesterase
MRMTTSDGISLSYEKRDGDTPTLILIHGWTNNRTVWKPLTDHLSYASIAPDLRGHGESDKPDDEHAYAIERFTEDITSLLDHEGIETCVLVGYSMGGMIALMTQDPRIEGLVLINTSAGIGERLPIGPGPFLTKIARFFEEHQKLIPSDLSDAYHNDFDTFLKGLAGTSPIATIRCFEEMYDLNASERLESISTLTLIIASEHDRVLPKRFSKALERIENSRLETVGESHFSLIDHAEDIARLIEGFVSSLQKSTKQ